MYHQDQDPARTKLLPLSEAYDIVYIEVYENLLFKNIWKYLLVTIVTLRSTST